MARAVDLAFEHFADYGRDSEILDLLADAMAEIHCPDSVRRRFVELGAADD